MMKSITGAICLCVSLCGGNVAGNNIGDTRAGRLNLELPPKVQFDKAAQVEMVELAAVLQRELKEAAEADDDDMITPDERWQRRTAQIQRFIDFYSRSFVKEAGLTSLLFVCRLSQGSNKSLYQPALGRLRALRQAHPNTWQARAAALLEATLLYDDDRAIPEAERIQRAYGVLRDTLPEEEPPIDWENPEVKSVRDILLMRPPIRAEHLLALASCEYMMAFPGASRPDTFDIEWLKKAKRSLDRLVDEFADSPQASIARERSVLIDDLLLKAQIHD